MQIISVVVGILLALFINDWVTQRQQQTAVDEAMRAIRKELTSNRAALHQSAMVLTSMVTALRSSPRNQNQPDHWCFQWDGWDGTNAANLVDSAYQTAIATQALAYMPFKQAQRVAQVYGHQHLKQKDFDMIQNKILVAGPQTLNMCITGVLGIVEDEHVLDTQYDPMIGADTTAWPTPASTASVQSAGFR
ncbi:MAG: hypothetical protein ACREPH_13955 [Rhodanobacteraceae bacterium]